MEDATKDHLNLGRTGPPPIEFGDLEKTRFIELVGAGVGRWLALKACGFRNYRVLPRAFRDDPEFHDEVILAERSLEDELQLNITERARDEGKANPEASKEALNMRWKVRSMAEANRSRRKAESLAERDMKIKEGIRPVDDQEDVSILDDEEIEALALIDDGEPATDAQRLAYARAGEKLARERKKREAAGSQGGAMP